ncbi:hypothetical protein TNCV_1473241 [Trichonephila clavipes]|nr:hypothetical protein TNCV_1473241 [Trichonephila clavipes]
MNHLLTGDEKWIVGKHGVRKNERQRGDTTFHIPVWRISEEHYVVLLMRQQEAMSDSKVRKWVRELKDERTNVHDEERSGRLSVIPDDGFGPCTTLPQPD